MIRIIIGVLLCILGAIGAVYFNIYLLVIGIIDIISTGEILIGILKIALREFVGAVFGFCLIFAGYAIGSGTIFKR